MFRGAGSKYDIDCRELRIYSVEGLQHSYILLEKYQRLPFTAGDRFLPWSGCFCYGPYKSAMMEKGCVYARDID